MLGVCYGDDYEYASTRLKGSIVFLKDDPIYVMAIGGDGIIKYTNLGGKEPYLTHLKELVLTPPTLGYVNTDMKSVYFKRLPLRQYRQGLSWDSLKRDGAKASDLRKCLKNIYPSFQNCVDEVWNREVFSRAFSKKFSVTTDSSKSSESPKLKIMFKDNVVGIFNTKLETLDLQQNFFHFRDEFNGIKNVPDFRFI